MPTSPGAMDAAAAIGTSDFVRRHDLWTAEQHEAAERAAARVAEEDLRTVRVSVGDPHGKLRGKTVLAGMFPAVLRNGIDFVSAIFHFDSADGIVYNPFVRDGSLGEEQLGGFPDVVLVPDPLTFTTLPWAPRTGWCSARSTTTTAPRCPSTPATSCAASSTCSRSGTGSTYLVGLEVEFYLARLVEAPLQLDAMGGPGNPPAPPQVTPLAPGYAYQSEDHQDQIESVLAALADNLMGAGLPLRTMEDEWGPGQCEFTFSPLRGMAAADAMLLFRSATKQVARRLGLHATFMCRPALPSYYASGWHLHQSLVDAGGVNVFATPSRLGRAAVADRPPLRRRPAGARRGRLGVHHAHPQRLPPPHPVLPGARPLHLGPGQPRRDAARPGRPGRPLDPRGEPGRRAGGEPLPLPGLPARRRHGRAGPRAGPRRARGRALLRGAPSPAPAHADGRGQGARQPARCTGAPSATASSTGCSASSASRSTASPRPRAPGTPRTSRSGSTASTSGSTEPSWRRR